ncbi:MAG: zinc-ribbon domain-containing protein [Actinomycetes bacterium]
MGINQDSDLQAANPTPATRTCTACGCAKPPAAYSRSKGRSQSQCQTCLGVKRQLKRAAADPAAATRHAFNQRNRMLVSERGCKACRVCRVDKPLTEFAASVRGLGGRRPECSECSSTTRKAARRTDPAFAARRAAEAELDRLIAEGYSRCTGTNGCRMIKPITEFDPTNRGRGVHSYCTTCRNAWQNNRRHLNRDEVNALARDRYRQQHWDESQLAAEAACTCPEKCFRGAAQRDASTMLMPTYPVIAAAFRANLDRPCRTAKFLTSDHHDNCRWQCVCGITFTKPINEITRAGHAFCRTCCLHGTSRLEFEVGELVRILTGTEVILHHRVAGATEIDLYLPAFGAAVNIDPFATHQGKHRLMVDRRISRQMARNYQRSVRVREKGLKRTRRCRMVGKNPTAREIADVIVAWLKVTPVVITATDEADALGRANGQWDALVRTPPEHSLARNATLLGEFRRNLTHPGRTTEFTPISCHDVMWWRCADPNCAREWPARLYSRSGRRAAGCPWCAKAESKGAQVRKNPQPEQSLADLHEGIAAELVANLSDPGRLADQLKPGSDDMGLWRCGNTVCERECRGESRYFTGQVGPRVRRDNTGCGTCNKSAARKRRAA